LAAPTSAVQLKVIAMLIRCAFFEGRIKPSMEEDFHNFVTEKLVPLWTKFPGAVEVRVLRQRESDTENPHYAMVLAIKYPDMAAIEKAMASDARLKSREVTGELLKMFDGRIFHTVFDLGHNVTL
jgi:antibiotic biosynthesis monooxygenase (ABM) superfamily enzyme